MTRRTAHATSYPHVPDWRQLGACASHPNPDLWFPEDTRSAKATAARIICSTCPLGVRTRCLDWAIANREVGIWAGTDHEERARMRSHLPIKEAVRMPAKRRELIAAAPLRAALEALQASKRVSRRELSRSLAYRANVGQESVSGFMHKPRPSVTSDWARKVCIGAGFDFDVLYPSVSEAA